MTVETTFAVSGQHYLFNVQTFAHTVLALGGDAYAYALRDRTTQGDLGVLFQTSATADEVNAALDAAGLEFVELIQSAPRVALPKSHPMVNAASLSLEDMEDFPYLYFEQDEDSPVAFAEEALASVPRAKSIACTDRASLSELIVALNGYTVTSGILVGISDGAGLNTVPLDTDVKLHLGYVVRKGEELGDIGQRFVDTLKNKPTLRAALAPHLRAIPQARVTIYASLARSRESGPPERPSLTRYANPVGCFALRASPSADVHPMPRFLRSGAFLFITIDKMRK